MELKKDEEIKQEVMIGIIIYSMKLLILIIIHLKKIFHQIVVFMMIIKLKIFTIQFQKKICY